MNKIAFFGECMIELFQNNDLSINQSFAGDTFNSAVYLKRTFTHSQVFFVSAIGKDSYSNKMLYQIKDESIDSEFIYRSSSKIPGLYSIQTDGKGERNFSYWRSDSAARFIMNHIDLGETEKLKEIDMFFFSGISLAVITPKDRDLFWKLVKTLKDAGVTIVFDPNYRAYLWPQQDDAKMAFEKAFSFCNICLPGVEDFYQLYGYQHSSEIVALCDTFDIDELVIKNGEEGILCVVDGVSFESDIEPVSNVVDTTSAGDSFNGVYLGARLDGLEPKNATELASRVAAEVIQYQGAIVPQIQFQKFIEQNIKIH